MLRKASSWVSSPLAVHLLLGAAGASGPSIDKYAQLSKLLAKDERNTLRSRVFIASSSEEQRKYGDLESQHVDFRNDADSNTISDWINQHAEETMGFKNDFPMDTRIALTNIHRFKDTWKEFNNGSPCMKLYNSFNYTQDVKYETRMLELPTSGDFKLVLLVPNETDVLPELFSKLRNEGLEAAASCLQPMFTTTTRLEAPSISICSKIIREQEIVTKSFTATGLQYGNIKISDEGIDINVLTCLYSTVDSAPIKKEEDMSFLEKRPCFFIALIFKDTPIFLGQYYP
ncbi:hypothetical protein ABMA28_006491 [Loxostege sticticalis]|uniref:Serpin domain-containing protein n=1 Tax=Loxostege sticticalis TaxID=481309 RepID=A0ABD0SLD7_LOXSC